MSISELIALSQEELLSMAEELGVDTSSDLSKDDLIEALTKAEEEGKEEEGRNPSIPYEVFKGIYAKVFSSGGAMKDLVSAVDEAGFGLRKPGELSSKLKGYRDKGIRFPKLANARGERVNIQEENNFWDSLVESQKQNS